MGMVRTARPREIRGSLGGRERVAVLPKDRVPVRAARLNGELGDREADDIGEGDEAGEEVHLAERDRSVAGAEVEGRESARQMDVRVRHRADPRGVPVVGDKLALLAVEDLVGVVDGDDLVVYWVVLAGFDLVLDRHRK